MSVLRKCVSQIREYTLLIVIILVIVYRLTCPTNNLFLNMPRLQTTFCLSSEYRLDWYLHLRKQFEDEHRRVRSVYPFETHCKIYTEIIFSLCTKLGYQGAPEIKYVSLKFFERLVENYLSQLGSSKIEDKNFLDQILPNMVTCIWIATKLLQTCDKTLSLHTITKFHPSLNENTIIKAELKALSELIDDLGRPNNYACMEVVLSATGLIRRSQFKYFIGIADKVLVLFKLNAYGLISKVFSMKSNR